MKEYIKPDAEYIKFDSEAVASDDGLPDISGGIASSDVLNPWG